MLVLTRAILRHLSKLPIRIIFSISRINLSRIRNQNRRVVAVAKNGTDINSRVEIMIRQVHIILACQCFVQARRPLNIAWKRLILRRERSFPHVRKLV
jgi:hypothetical protein